MYETLDLLTAAKKAEEALDWQAAADNWAQLVSINPDNDHFKTQRDACLLLLEARANGDRFRAAARHGL